MAYACVTQIHNKMNLSFTNWVLQTFTDGNKAEQFIVKLCSLKEVVKTNFVEELTIEYQRCSCENFSHFKCSMNMNVVNFD